MATHSSILAWRIPWKEEPGGLQRGPWGHKELDTAEQITLSFTSHNFIHIHQTGNDYPDTHMPM